MTKREIIILAAMVICILAIGISLGRCTAKTQNELILPDYSQWEGKSKEWQRKFELNKDTIANLYDSIEVLNKIKYTNHKVLINDINRIKGFSRITRNKFIDSVYNAESK